MRCSRVQYLYEDYVAGGLPPETMDRIDAHIAGCGLCRDFFETNDDLSELIQHGVEVVHPGDGYLEEISSRVLARLRAPEEPVRATATGSPWNRPFWWSGATAAAAVLLVVVRGGDPPVHPRELARREAPSPVEYDVRVGRSGQPLIHPVSSRAGESPQGSPGAVSSGSALSKSGREVAAARSSDLDARSAIFSLMTTIQPAPTRAPESPAASRGPSLNLNFNIPAERLAEVTSLEAMHPEQARARAEELLGEFRRSLFERQAGEAGADPETARQWGRFWEGESALRERDFDRAEAEFRAAIEAEGDPGLALRATFRLANLKFDERGDFAAASRLYGRLKQAPDLERALAPAEREHLNLRVRVLERFATNDWRALQLMHQISRGGWGRAASSLEAMIAHPEARYLLPEASGIVRGRLERGERMDEESARRMASLLERALAPVGDGAPKAWVHVALADVLWLHFRAEEAARHYGEAAQTEVGSAASDLARRRLDEMTLARTGVSRR